MSAAEGEIEVQPVIIFHRGRESEVNGERSPCRQVAKVRVTCQEYKFMVTPLGVVTWGSRGKEHDLT